MVDDPTDEGSVDHAIMNISDIPSGRVKEAAALLDLANSCTSSCPELTGLYYDQLSAMLTASHHLNRYFLTWLYSITQEEFESLYIVDSLPNKIADIELSMQYIMNR